MTVRARVSVVMFAAIWCIAGACAPAQQSQQSQQFGMQQPHFRHPLRAQSAAASAAPVAAASQPLPAAAPEAGAAIQGTVPRSLLDEPASPAQINISGNRLLINANNASLTQVIHQVASDTGMQVEGNTRDERVFGSYGPGSPEEVLSALLYDSGYNMIMVGSTADGAPRRLVLSTRAAGGTTQVATGAVRNSNSNEEEEEEAPAEPPPQPGPSMQTAAPGLPPGQPKTPQQMLEELQRMHQGQQPQDIPHE